MSDIPSVESDLAADLAAGRAKVIALLEKLPLAKLELILHYSQNEIKRLDPAFLEAESRLKSIWDHLISSFEKGEHAVVNDVHEFLLQRAQSVPPAEGQVVS